MKKAIDKLIDKRKQEFVTEGVVAQIYRDDRDNIIAADVTIAGGTRKIKTTLQDIYPKDLVQIQIPFGDMQRAAIISSSRIVADFTHYAVGGDDG